MTRPVYSGDLKAAVVQQAMRAGTPVAELATRYNLPARLIRRWLHRAADAIPAVFSPAGKRSATAPGQPQIEADNKFRTLFETSQDAIMLLTEDGFFDCNRSTLGIYGIPTIEEFVRFHPSDLSPPTQPSGGTSLELANQHIMCAIQTGSDRFEWTHRRANGEDFEADVLLSSFMQDGRPILQASVRDISETKRLQRSLAASNAELRRAHDQVERQNRELERLCVTDQLTGLYNRRRLDEVIETEGRLARRTRCPLAMVIADIDHFKRINDTLGHQCGDQVLRDIAALLKSNVRDADVVGRWGGEEFMIVCRGTNLNQARVLAERLRTKMEIHSFAFEHAEGTTCSFGVAAFNAARGTEAMIRDADDALYEAKAAGRNRVITSHRKVATKSARKRPDPDTDRNDRQG
jgi:diguanylate cyclase (GGDEF)-like protein/PAS domain S-box-containing protein